MHERVPKTPLVAKMNNDSQRKLATSDFKMFPIGHQHHNMRHIICQNVMSVTDMLCWRHEIQPGAKFNNFFPSLNRS